MFCGILQAARTFRVYPAASIFIKGGSSYHNLPSCRHNLQLPAAHLKCFKIELRPMATSTKSTNRLAKEKSPYLLQHAHNPVDWYPWGEEAFEEARKQDKLIFLSVGYSTCHWCHVMEHESFENEEIAKIMNENFINIKVDREERPDVDKVYMTFVQASSGRGGWPMSVFLTPDLVPVAGGTYFPPKNTFGRPGFDTVLTSISNQWKENKQKFFDSGSKILEILERTSKLELNDGQSQISSESWKKCLQQLSKAFEHQYGGFSKAPKFPQPSNFNFLFQVYARNPESVEGKSALSMCVHTLKMMAKGGIHDHISQGFARYSTDEKWHVPHFEKMLYDQGQLLVSFSQAYVATKDEFFREIILDIITYVNRDLSHATGGFFSAEDADSLPGFDSPKKKEGAFCVWTNEEVDSLLGSKSVKEGSSVTLSDLACHHFDIQPDGNVNPYQDPHDELKNQNVLIVNGSEEETSEKFGLTLAETKAALKQIQSILHEARQNRPRPHLDDKMVAAWNGLMLSGLSKAYEAICDETVLDRAIRAADFLKEHMYNETTGTLLRCCYQDEKGNISQINEPISGFADDYAFVIRGLIDLYEASGQSRWLTWANDLQEKQDKLFWDNENAGYFSTAQNSHILLRLKDGQDGAEPTCNSVSAANLMRLSGMLERDELEEKAIKLLSAFKERLEKIPVALPEMSASLFLLQDSPTQVVVTGDPKSEGAQNLLAEIRSRLIPGRVLGFADGDEDGILYQRNATIKKMKVSKDGSASAYVCRNHTCSLPVTKPEQLRGLLDERLSSK
ncbi:spermatogenesis-associated protein 20 isoform X2 [Neocloeon triangulifer]|uniref:spermatogenesis-associated protein 20 isoform X2 n=1 Tax=Neocloeon triangulifer TaxID=2078957 RepID=UPI00286F3050|nr:spermatogenesis-associated protein 20 isoform X2 [Neocloeon triangulifer]